MFLGKKTFRIYKQLNAPLKVTPEAHANEQNEEKKESPSENEPETETKMHCLKHTKC